jgi:metal-dependent amidase/aminoacylase/carboxypeptidase family protein
MEADPRGNVDGLAARLHSLLPDLEAIYKDLHQNPELSTQEMRIAGTVADHLRSAGYEVTRASGRPA